MEKSVAGHLVEVAIDGFGMPELILPPNDRRAVSILRVLDHWRDLDIPEDRGLPRENWLIATETGIYMLQQVIRSEWRLYGWHEQSSDRSDGREDLRYEERGDTLSRYPTWQ